MPLGENATIPNWANAADSDVSAIRDRFAWVIAALIANGIVMLPNWASTPYSTSSPQNFAEPNYWIMTANDDNRELRIDLTWSSSKITQVVCKYNAGVSSPGMATLTGGTITVAYDGDGNVTGITSA